MQRFVSFASFSLRRASALSLATRAASTPGKVKVNVTTQDGTACAFDAPTGASLMTAIRDVAGLEMDGACDGCMQCSTCHVYVSEAWYSKIGAPSEDEQDILDKALEAKDTSRLACQIQLTEAMDGIEVAMPKQVVNLLM